MRSEARDEICGGFYIMKKLNVMLHTEVIECLRQLDDESLSKIMRMIFDWNDGIEIEPTTQIEKFAWALILPKLETNKETYLTTLETRQRVGRENGSKGGAPKGNQNARKSVNTEENPMDFNNNQKQPKTTQNKLNNPNYNYNYNNSSKEELCIDRDLQPEALEGASVGIEGTSVSKGLEALENIFPQRKRDIGITEINLWNSLSQPQKSNLVKKASLYVRGELKNEDGKFIKKLSKWMGEEFNKGIEEEVIPKKKHTSTKTYKSIDGNIFNILEEKLGCSKDSNYIYHILNGYGLTKQEFRSVVEESSKEELLNLK